MPYRKLNVYQKSYEKALEIHRLTLKLPKEEQYALGQQIRMSSKSIPANLAEGMGKQESPGEVRRFAKIALGSCDETRVWLDFCKDLGYVDENIHQKLSEDYCEIGRMLNGIIKRFSS